MCATGSVVVKHDEDRSVAAKDQEYRSTAAKDQEEWSDATRDRKIKVFLQRIKWSSAIEDEDSVL